MSSIKKIKLGNKTFAYDHSKENLLIASSREAKRNNKKNYPFEYGNAQKGKAVSTFRLIGYTCLVATRLESGETMQFLVTQHTKDDTIKNFDDIIKQAKSLIPIAKIKKIENITNMTEAITYISQCEISELDNLIVEAEKEHEKLISNLDRNNESDQKIEEQAVHILTFKKLVYSKARELKDLVDGNAGDTFEVEGVKYAVPVPVMDAINKLGITIRELQEQNEPKDSVKKSKKGVLKALPQKK